MVLYITSCFCLGSGLLLITSLLLSHAPILYGCEPLHFHEARENWQHINTLFGMVERGKKGKDREGKEAISTFWLQRWRGSGGELEWCISTWHISVSAQNGQKRRKSWNLKTWWWQWPGLKILWKKLPTYTYHMHNHKRENYIMRSE